MASLGGTIAPAPATSYSKSTLLNHQNDHNEPMKDSFNTTTEVQDSQSDNEKPNNASTSMTAQKVRAIIQNDLTKRLVGLPKEYFDRHLQLQRNSPFWSKLFNPSQNADMTYRPPLISREWAEYVVDASHIFFEAGLSVKKVVSIIDRAIRFAAICLLNSGTEKIYFEDGRNLFYDFASRGMPKELKTKYKAFLKGMRASIFEGKEEVQSDREMSTMMPESGDESASDVGEVSQLEDAVAPAEDAVTITSQEGRQGTTDTLPWELSTTPTEVKASTLNTKEKSDRQNQTTKNPPKTKKKRNRKRENSRGKERKKRARLRAKLLSESKVEKRRRWRQNRKRKEKMKKRNEAARQAAGV